MRRRLPRRSQLADYLTLANNVNKQSDAIAFPLVKAKTLYDLQTLKQLVATVNQTHGIQQLRQDQLPHRLRILRQG